MAVIFNVPLMLSLSSSSLAKLVPQTRCSGRWKVWWRKESAAERYASCCCRFRPQCAGIPGMSKPEALCASGGRRSTCCGTAASSGKQAWGLPFSWWATCPTALEHPGSPFYVWEQLSVTGKYKTQLGKQANSYFQGNETTVGSASRCGLPGSIQITFLPLLCAGIEAGLQHLRPWHRHLGEDLESLQEAQETHALGQKLEAGSTRSCSGGWMI